MGKVISTSIHKSLINHEHEIDSIHLYRAKFKKY